MVPIGLSFALWSFTSPIGGSPDEPSHITYAWSIASGQGFGDVDISCETDIRPCPRTNVEVPADLWRSSSCYAFQPAVSAACAPLRQAGTASTQTLWYPPLYYGLIGGVVRAAFAVGAGGETAAHAGRLASGAISLSLITPALVLAWTHARRLVPALVVLMSPMTYFMVGSINPSGTEITSAMAAATAIVILARSPQLRSAQLLLAYASTWLVWTRPLGFLWTAALAIAGFVFVGLSDNVRERRRETARALRALIGFVVANIAAAALWFAHAARIHGTVIGDRAPSIPDPGLETLTAIALRWGDMLWENLGVLGWLDTPLPTLMTLTIAATVTIIVYDALTAEANIGQRRTAVSYLACIMIGTSAIMYQQQFLWQGRYALPALAAGVVLISGSSTARATQGLFVASSIAWVTGVLAAAWLYARYAFGIQIGARHSIPNVSDDAQWLGPLGGPGFAIAALLTASSLPVTLYVMWHRDAQTLRGR